MDIHLFCKILFSLFLSARAVTSDGRNTLRSRPVVGILSQPAFHSRGSDYIAASYVKWLESAGARSIVIPYGADDDLIKEIFTQINGVLFPGGDSTLPQSAKLIWKLILDYNMNEDNFFPVWGTCLGFEFLVMLAGGEEILQSGFDSENISLPLIFPSEEDVVESNGVYSTESVLYPVASSIRETLSRSSITMNNHNQGITPAQFLNSSKLTEFFQITSTNLDMKGRPFVSTIEAKQYPVYGVMYHPEKNNFEYGLMDADQTLTEYQIDEPYEAINHSEEAVQLSMQLASFFVDKVRRSTNGIYNMTKRHPVLYQYPVVSGREFEEQFIIPQAEDWKKESDEKKPWNYNGLEWMVALVCIISFFSFIYRRYNFMNKNDYDSIH